MEKTRAVIAEILDERARQALEEGFTRLHDDRANNHGELAKAASAYAFPIYLQAGEHKPAQPIQWEWDPRWYKSTTKRRYYIKAAALLVAEIERLDRQTAKS